MTLARDTPAYYQPGEPILIGTLKQGAQVQLGTEPQAGRIAYILLKGEGPAFGWLNSDAVE